MNFELLNAEMEVRKSGWGPAIGGLQDEPKICAIWIEQIKREKEEVAYADKKRRSVG